MSRSAAKAPVPSCPMIPQLHIPLLPPLLNGWGALGQPQPLERTATTVPLAGGALGLYTVPELWKSTCSSGRENNAFKKPRPLAAGSFAPRLNTDSRTTANVLA